MSKLSVRLVRPNFGDGLVLSLCDADGKSLPGQRKVVVESQMNDVVTVTVEFVVGRDVTIEGAAGTE